MLWLLAYKPERCGERPVKMAVREGLQAGAGQWALVKSTPEAASRSRLGVRACGWPPRQPIQSFKSSMAMKRTLGLAIAAAFASETLRMQNNKQINHI